MFLVAKYESDGSLMPFDIREEHPKHMLFMLLMWRTWRTTGKYLMNRRRFHTTREKECNGLLEHTLEAVYMKPGANVRSTKWVDKVKPDGTLKSRLVVQGFTQLWLKDYHDALSAVATLRNFRLLLHSAAILGWVVYTIDVSQAYTQGEPHQETFIRAPATHPHFQ